MTEQQILQVIAEIAATELDYHDTLAPTDRLVEDLKLDSLKALTLVVAIENRFEIALTREQEVRILRIEDLVQTIHRQLRERPVE